MNVAAILLLLVALGATRTKGAGVVELASAGTNFDDLPYADWLSAGNNRINISIELGYVMLYRGGLEFDRGWWVWPERVKEFIFRFIFPVFLQQPRTHPARLAHLVAVL